MKESIFLICYFSFSLLIFLCFYFLPLDENFSYKDLKKYRKKIKNWKKSKDYDENFFLHWDHNRHRKIQETR